MKKYTLFHFSTGDFKALEVYLNEQAARGWELERRGLLFARWKKTERADLRWCIDLAKPQQGREWRKEYVDFCREGGWELFDFTGSAYLFRSVEGMDPPPVQTDSELERKNYNRYYIRSNILSVVVLALYFVMLFGFSARLASVGRIAAVLAALRLEAHSSWLAVGIFAAAPLWLLWVVWKLFDFTRAMISNRGGVIGVPPRWVMWTNCVVGTLALLGGLIFLLGYMLETVLQGKADIGNFVMMIIWAAAAFLRLLTYDFELHQGERRNVRRLGIMFLAVFALCIAVRLALPYGEWSSYQTGSIPEDKYEVMQTAPLVQGADLGIELEFDKSDFYDFHWEYTPVGQRFYLRTHDFDPGASRRLICETYRCPTDWQADIVLRQLLALSEWWSAPEHREGQSSLNILNYPPQASLAPVALDWAEEAWYGETEGEAILVVRVGRQVTMLYGLHFGTAEKLAAVKSRLCP